MYTQDSVSIGVKDSKVLYLPHRRIKQVEYRNGNSRYYPQKRIFNLFWVNLINSEYSNSYTTTYADSLKILHDEYGSKVKLVSYFYFGGKE